MTTHIQNLTGRPITWAQVSLKAMEEISELVDRNPHAAKLLLRLMRRMENSGQGGVVVLSRQTMAEILKTSLPTADRALRLLIKEGWVQRIKVGGAHALAINAQIAWTDIRGKLDYAIFNATVIASRQEQDAIALNPPPMRELPIVRRDELALPIGPGMDPPSERELDGMPPIFDGINTP